MRLLCGLVSLCFTVSGCSFIFGGASDEGGDAGGTNLIRDSGVDSGISARDAGTEDASSENCPVQDTLSCDPNNTAPGNLCSLSSLVTDFGKDSWETYWEAKSSFYQEFDLNTLIESTCDALVFREDKLQSTVDGQVEVIENVAMEVRAKDFFHGNAGESIRFRLKTDPMHFGAYVILYDRNQTSRLRLNFWQDSVIMNQKSPSGTICDGSDNATEEELKNCADKLGLVPRNQFFEIIVKFESQGIDQSGIEIELIDNNGNSVWSEEKNLYFDTTSINPAFGFEQDSSTGTNVFEVDSINR